MEKGLGLSKDHIGITVFEEGDREGGILQEISVRKGEYQDGSNTTLACHPQHRVGDQQQTEYTAVQMDEKRADENISKSFCRGLYQVILQRIHLAEERPPEPQQTVRKDGGFCWMVVVASFFAYFLFAGTRSSMGIVQEELGKTLQEASSTLAWTGSLVNSLPLLLAPAVSGMTKLTSCGFLSSAGGVISSAGFLLVTFTNSAPLILVGLGLFPGLGLGLMVISSTFMVSDCFEKRRGFAIALSVAGGGLGFIVFPMMFSVLVNLYGLRGTFLVCSALYLNGILFGFIYRQVQNQSIIRERQSVLSGIKTTLCDRYSMGSPNCVSLTFSTFMFGVSDTIPFLFLPSKAMDMKLSRELSAMLISTIGFTSITGRIGIGILTGKSQQRRMISFILAFLVCSASMAIYARAESYIIFIVGSCCFGVSTGCLYSLLPVVLIDMFGVDKFPTSFGVNNLSFGIGSLLAGPMTNALFAVVQDPDLPFYIAGIATLLGALSLVFTNPSLKRIKLTTASVSADSGGDPVFTISYSSSVGAPAA